MKRNLKCTCACSIYISETLIFAHPQRKRRITICYWHTNECKMVHAPTYIDSIDDGLCIVQITWPFFNHLVQCLHTQGENIPVQVAVTKILCSLITRLPSHAEHWKAGTRAWKQARCCNKTTLVGCFQYLAVFSHEHIEDYFVESCTKFGVLVWDVGEDHLSEAKEILIVC